MGGEGGKEEEEDIWISLPVGRTSLPSAGPSSGQLVNHIMQQQVRRLSIADQSWLAGNEGGEHAFTS